MRSIDNLRNLLEEFDRSRVSVTGLVGQIETTDFSDTYRSFADSGDRAYIFLGSSDKLSAERREDIDGTVVYTFRLKP